MRKGETFFSFVLDAFRECEMYLRCFNKNSFFQHMDARVYVPVHPEAFE